MKSVDHMRKQKAISVNEIMNKVNQAGYNPEKRYCGDMPENTQINEYEWK
jgi:predicted HicB family RNase H-like nuclease